VLFVSSSPTSPLLVPLQTEFALRYLPNLLEAFRSPVTNLLHNWWTEVLSLVSALPIFAVFMKSKHPAALGLEEVVVDKLVVLIPDFSIFSSTRDVSWLHSPTSPLNQADFSSPLSLV